MKIKQEHYRHLESSINAVLDGNGRERIMEMYRAGQFRNADKVTDLQRRFCFDLLYAAVPSTWVCDNLYPYLDDTHIYTAIKKICPKL